MKVRLITCQGTIQLLTALTVLRQHELLSQAKDKYIDYLLIYGLYSSDSQKELFINTIIALANSIINFKKIITITDLDLHYLEDNCTNSKYYVSSRFIKTVLKLNTVDEIYLCRNQQFMNIFLMNVFRTAQKICYGDGIGIFYSEQYYYESFEGQQSIPFLGFVQYKKNVIDFIFQRKLDLINFDIGYFLIPTFDSTPNMPYGKISTDVYKEIIRLASNIIPQKIQATLGALNNKNFFLLLTSNFSEAGRIEQDKEVYNYLEIILNNIENFDNVIIKPHPRDSMEKISKIRDYLISKNKKVILLTEDILFYLPIEVILYSIYCKFNILTSANIKVICFTSACFSFPLFFEIIPEIGFGEKIVRESFNNRFIKSRIHNEIDLNRVLNEKLL